MQLEEDVYKVSVSGAAPGLAREAVATCKASVLGLERGPAGKTRASVPGLARELPSMLGLAREVGPAPSIIYQNMKGWNRTQSKRNKINILGLGMAILNLFICVPSVRSLIFNQEGWAVNKDKLCGFSRIH